jgi:predicted nucleic acid-binding protein
VNYLLDTNACIALINGKPPSVRARFQTATDKGAKVFVSSIAAFELWYGVAKSSRREFNKKRLEAFFAARFIRSSSGMRTLKSPEQSRLILKPPESLSVLTTC